MPSAGNPPFETRTGRSRGFRPTDAGGIDGITRNGYGLARIANVYPHALRHACGHALAVKGRDMRLVQEYMGHTNVQNTARYMDGVSGRFRGIWD
jgi:integrase